MVAGGMVVQPLYTASVLRPQEIGGGWFAGSPQRLKPHSLGALYGAAEAALFQSNLELTPCNYDL